MSCTIRLLVTVALVLAGCASPATRGVTPASPAPLTETVDGLRQRPIGGNGAVFVAAPAPDWSRFQAVFVEPPRIDYAARSARPSPRDEERLREQLRLVLVRELAGGLGWEPVTEPGSRAPLRVRCAISDLELEAPPASAVRTTAFQSPTGHVGFVLELEDADRGAPLLRFGERRPLPGGTFVGPPWTELQRTREAFRRFALDAGAAIAELSGGRISP